MLPGSVARSRNPPPKVAFLSVGFPARMFCVLPTWQSTGAAHPAFFATTFRAQVARGTSNRCCCPPTGVVWGHLNTPKELAELPCPRTPAMP